MSIKLLLASLIASCLPAQTIHHVLVSGQSLSRGDHGTPVLTTSDPYGNFTLSGPDELGTTFTSLIATNWGEPGEAYAFAAGAALSAMVTGYTTAWTIHGQDGAPWSDVGVPWKQPYINGQIQVANVKAAAAVLGRAYDLCCLVWTHGESDSGVVGEGYQSKLLQTQGYYSADRLTVTGQTGTMPMFIDQVGSGAISGNNAGTDIQEQWEAARDNPNSIYLTAPKYQAPYYTDSIHLTNVGYQILGELHARAIKTVMIDGKRWAPLSPVSITSPTSTTILVKFYVPQGPLVLDTTTLPAVTPDAGNCTASSCYGFEVWCAPVARTSCLDVGSAPVTISNVAVTASDTVTITLSAAIAAGTVSVRLGLYSVGGTASGTAQAPHTNFRDSSPDIGLYSGAHLYNWAVFWNQGIGFTWTPPSLPSLPATTAITGEKWTGSFR